MRWRKRQPEPPVQVNVQAFIEALVRDRVERDCPGAVVGTWTLAIEYINPDGLHCAIAERPTGVSAEFAANLLKSAAKGCVV